MKKILWILVAVVLVGWILYSNIQQQKEQSNGKRNVYVLLPLTGMYANAGNEMNDLLTRYQKQQSSNLNIITIDSQSDSGKSLSAIQQATINEKHPIVLTSETATVNGFMPLLEQKDGFMIIFGGIAYPQNYSKFQRITYGAKDAVLPQIEYMKDKKINDTVLLYSFNDYGNIVASAFRDEYKKHQGNILAEFSFVPSDPDIRIMISKVLSYNPSSIFISSVYCIALQNIIKELKLQGYKGQIFADPLFSQPYFLNNMVNETEGVIFLSPKIDNNDKSIASNIINEFITENKITPSVYAISLLDAIQAIDILTSKRLEIKRKSFEQELKKINSAEFIGNGNAWYYFQLSTMKDGKVVPLESETK